MSNGRLYKASELADILRVSPRQIYRLAEQGEIESYRIGQSVRFLNPMESERRNKAYDKTATENY